MKPPMPGEIVMWREHREGGAMAHGRLRSVIAMALSSKGTVSNGPRVIWRGSRAISDSTVGPGHSTTSTRGGRAVLSGIMAVVRPTRLGAPPPRVAAAALLSCESPVK
jgi:hypothetical protein